MRIIIIIQLHNEEILYKYFNLLIINTCEDTTFFVTHHIRIIL